MPADAAEIVRLAERVEQATGPDRELDGSIAWAIGEFDRYQLGPQTTVSFHRIDERERAEIHVIGPKGGRVIYTHDPLRYTASLDAAMTLAPEGEWFVSLVRDPSGISYAGVGFQPGDTGRPALSPALAITAAALRARAAQHDHEVG